MEFRSQDDEMGMPTSLGYNNPPPIRGSAFTKPSPSPTSSSLHSPRGGGGGGGGGAGGSRNGNLFGNPTPPPLNPNPTTIDCSNPSHINLGNNPIPAAPIPIPSPPAGTSASPNPKSSAATNTTNSQVIPSADAASASRYRECLRNHAAAMGSHVVDGCGEFMPAGHAPPEALKCAACGCHRSFHRREINGDAAPNAGYYRGSPRFPLLLPPPHPLQPHHQHQKQYAFGFPSTPSPAAAAAGSSAVAAFGGGGTSASGGTTTESSSEERMTHLAPGAAPPSAGVVSKKRVRTRFTPEQKTKMLAFAERVGWRIHKQDEALVQQLCSEIGVRRQVLKVWMHNNKHTSSRKQQQQQDDQRQLQLHQELPTHQHQPPS